ncbi:MAG: acyl-CoA/acyl-ACP dehydrogenase [Proteobacteria bacterium]|nr:acyl-CoA/acyl-ACP dehydrogenase [Pseudomonadota bacterium]
MTDWIAAARAAGDVAARHADEVDRQARFPAEAMAALRDAKLLGLLVPKDEGGPGAGIADIVSICHLLGQRCAATAMIYAMHQIQASCLVRHHGGAAWQRAFLKRLASEQLLLASATSEAGVGGDVRSSVCAVEEKDGRFALAKQATVISYGADADGILVTARRTPQSPASDQVIVVVSQKDARFEALQGWDTLGMRGTCSNGFHLKAEGEVGQIMPVPYADISAQTMLPTSHLVWSALWLGIATDAVARARAFVRAEARKKQGATPPGALRLAEATGQLQLMKAGLVSALRQYEAALGSEDALSALPFAIAMNTLKITSSQMVVQIVGQALQVCGLAGYRNDSAFSLGRHLRDAHSAALMVNNDRILANTAQLVTAVRDDSGLLA